MAVMKQSQQDRSAYYRDYSRARVAAVRQLIERHGEEFKNLLSAERMRLKAQRARNGAKRGRPAA